MPEISRFFGIVIYIDYGDHAPPHFHALYAGQTAVIDIRTHTVLQGHLPPRILALVRRWADLRQSELETAFAKAQIMQAPAKIAPLS